jgi:hypothetical protein
MKGYKSQVGSSAEQCEDHLASFLQRGLFANAYHMKNFLFQLQMLLKKMKCALNSASFVLLLLSDQILIIIV